MTTEEKTYEITFHLIDGTRLTSSQRCDWQTVGELYRCLGNEGGDGRVKFPRGPRNMQFIPATSILRMEVNGELQ